MTPREFLETAARGAVMPVPGETMKFWVMGSEQVYQVTLADPDRDEVDECECVGFQWRAQCYHLDRVERHLSEFKRKRREFQDDEELRRLFA